MSVLSQSCAPALVQRAALDQQHIHAGEDEVLADGGQHLDKGRAERYDALLGELDQHRADERADDGAQAADDHHGDQPDRVEQQGRIWLGILLCAAVAAHHAGL